jgi:LacI family transcriptional regulator
MYCRRVVSGIAAIGAEAGWEWFLVPSEAALRLTLSSPTALDGVIGNFAEITFADKLLRSGLPAVDISAAGSPTTAVRVTSDDVAVGRVAATYLLSLGLVHFGFFGWQGRRDSQLRGNGFTKAIAACGLTNETFFWPSSASNEYDAKKPNEELARWIKALPKPVGLFACIDRRALQLLTACRKLGFDVPDAVSVVGVDNDEVFCELANPSLSSIALSTQRIGYEAGRTLDRLMRGRKPRESEVLIPPAGVVPRRSSGRKVIIDADVAAAVRYIALNVKDDLQVADVLREINVSRRTLDQRFLKVLGRTPAEEILRAQLELAKHALTETNESMVRVAAMSGFSNAKQMGVTFRSATGIKPTDYRRQHRF